MGLLDGRCKSAGQNSFQTRYCSGMLLNCRMAIGWFASTRPDGPCQKTIELAPGFCFAGGVLESLERYTRDSGDHVTHLLPRISDEAAGWLWPRAWREEAVCRTISSIIR
jgi:hypothetical protein